MATDGTALVLALPTDSVETLRQKVLQAGASWVQLLVPEGVATLQQPQALATLREAAARAGLDLVVISADEATLAAARASELLTMEVRGARVLPPAAPPAPAAPDAVPPAAPASEAVDPFATRPLSREPRDVATSRLASDLSAGDAAFLDALDDLDAAPTRRETRPIADHEIDQAVDSLISLYRSDREYLDDPNNQAPPGTVDRLRAQAAADADEDLAAALNSIDADRSPRTAPIPLPPPSSVRRPRPVEAPPARRPATIVRQPAPAARRAGGLSWLIPVILLVLLLLIVLAGAWLLFGGGTATVTVRAPVAPDTVETVEPLAVPLAPPGSEPAGTAVEGAVLSADVSASAEGRVSEGVSAPAGTAGGTVTVLSLNSQPIVLPAGTEFVAIKPDGQEVPFVSAAEVVVPAATTSDQGAQIVTTRGTATVPVSARSPGSASNVDGNSIRRMTIPGGASFAVESGSGPLIVRHDPLGGGSEEIVFVVRESDVDPVRDAALAQLVASAVPALQQQAAAQGLQIDETTLSPRQAEIERRQGFDVSISPGIGETLDPNNPIFTVTVQANYSALAVPEGRTLFDQLGGVYKEQLLQAGLLRAGDCRAPFVEGWRLDGSTLFVEGRIGPDPRCGGNLDPALLQQIEAQLRGKSRAEAQAILDGLVAQGSIGAYSLPDVERLPSWDMQLNVVTEP